MSYGVAVFTRKIKGTISFYQPKNSKNVRVTFDLLCSRKNKTMGCHIHEYGDIREGCKSLGPHWNPKNKEHGSYKFNGLDHHAGDLLNNIHSDKKGRVKLTYTDKLIKLRGPNSIFGRSVVIHEGVDDLGLGGYPDSKTTGHAGKRRACAIIARSKK